MTGGARLILKAPVARRELAIVSRDVSMTFSERASAKQRPESSDSNDGFAVKDRTWRERWTPGRCRDPEVRDGRHKEHHSKTCLAPSLTLDDKHAH